MSNINRDHIFDKIIRTNYNSKNFAKVCKIINPGYIGLADLGLMAFQPLKCFAMAEPGKFMGLYKPDNKTRIGFGIFPQDPSNGFSDEKLFRILKLQDNTSQQACIRFTFVFQLK